MNQADSPAARVELSETQRAGMQVQGAGGPERTTLFEGRIEVCAKLPDGRKEVFGKERRKVELVGLEGAGGRVVVTNLWTGVITILPADAVVSIYP